ncbi:hypothetical protein CAL14_08405 [Bordetella genomosp. 9]|uniref:hypothetical protein n=1 Tax=Bordetella genomosp. 9 TaxID=1416803 RepID=UPI000A28F665|nr:hypothetical protein [Bordetella genomosp. 9]ARP90304.1 hypothetical protein CAL14_08405 [Bordetella genomosp. 9]
MTGDKALIRARLQGFTPADVFVVVLDVEPSKRGFRAAEESLELTGIPEIDVGPKDIPGTLDLRCIRGARVHVCGEDSRRVRAVASRARLFQPAEILAAVDGAILRWRPKA